MMQFLRKACIDCQPQGLSPPRTIAGYPGSATAFVVKYIIFSRTLQIEF